MHRHGWAGWLTVLFLGALVAVPAGAQSLPPRAVQKRILRNGLTVLVREDHSAPVVSAQAWVRAGSITEGAWMGAGLSHVLEHMLFKGTATRGVAEIARTIEDKGGDMNAYTSFERTVFHIDIPAENWETAVSVLADCVMNATIPEAELLKEKRVILREMAMNQDDPDRRASLTLWATAFTTHPYRHPVIGYPDIYNRVTRADVDAYYKRNYVPNNLLFVVVGDIQAADVLAKIEGLTKEFKRGPIAPVFVPPEPPQLSLRTRDEEMAIQLSQVHLAWHIPGVADPDVYPLDVLAIIAGQGRSSRLYRELLEQRGLVHTIAASSYTPRYPGLWEIEATADADQRAAAIAAIRAEVRQLVAQPVSAAELQKAIKISTSNLLDRLKTMDGQAADIAENDLLVDDPDFSARYLQRLRAVTVADVQRVARKYLTDNNLTITTLNPRGTLPAPLPAAVPAAGIKIQKFALPNGVRLLVREDPKLPVVDLRAILEGGVLAETATDNGITKLMARMLLKGTTTRTADQIANSLESVGGDIEYFAGNNSFGVSTHVLRDDFDLGLAVLADVLQHPTFPRDLFGRERDTQLAELKDEQDRIMPVAQQLLRATMFRQSPYRLNPLGTAATLADLTPAALAEFHRRYVVAGNLVLCVFGDVKAAVVREKVAALFGGMPTAKPAFPPNAPEHLAATVERQKSLPKEQAVVLLGFSGTDLFSKDRAALELLDTAYSGQGSRLFLRIRDELGLAYYVGAYELLGLAPGYFAFYAGTTPQNVATCEKEFFAELDRLKTNGLSEEELARARNNLIGQQEVQMQDNADLALTAGLDELYGLGYDYFQSAPARYRAVTVNDIKAVAAKYFADKPHAVVVVAPDK